MSNYKTFESITHNNKGIIIVNEHTKLTIDCIYESQRNNSNISADVLSKLMRVKNQGGIRYIGNLSTFNLKYVVLYTTGNDTYWIDSLDQETGILTYFGDNKTSGTSLHHTKIHGNEILRDSFANASGDLVDRLKCPPFFVFQKAEKERDVRFLGLAVPGNKSINNMEWLVALWASREDKTRFQNYRAYFTILDTSTGTDDSPRSADIDIQWLNDLVEGNGYTSKYAPRSWKHWIDTGQYTPLICKKERLVRTKEEQLPSDIKDRKVLKVICDYFKDDPTRFEKFAIDVALMLDDNIVDLENTRPTKDGGKDGEGLYRVGEAESSYVFPFALEAKCYNDSNGVGVKETSRLISRIKMREFGIFVTTSYISKQAYQEIIEDDHPIIIISGIDIVKLLYKNGYCTYGLIKNKLCNY